MVTQEEIDRVRAELGVDASKIIETRERIKEANIELKELLELEDYLLSKCTHPNVKNRNVMNGRRVEVILDCPYCCTTYGI